MKKSLINNQRNKVVSKNLHLLLTLHTHRKGDGNFWRFDWSVGGEQVVFTAQVTMVNSCFTVQTSTKDPTQFIFP